jgi:predicted dinucleotide-binding enzyme
MRYGILGTGRVGQTLGSRLVSLGHEVSLGSRTAANPAATEWASKAGDRASHGTFQDAAAFGEIVINATKGTASLDALATAGAENLSGKVLIDLANAGERGQEVFQLAYTGADSLAERIQAAYPDAKVVKTLNTMTVAIMINPAALPAPTVVFVSGDDGDAKKAVGELLGSFGWPAESIIDLGGIVSARVAEGYVPLWHKLFRHYGSPMLNIAVVR